jgi:hypothetical protein
LAGRLVDRMARVFVSSTFKDLDECRKKVRTVLKQLGHENLAMGYFIAEYKRSLDKCPEAVTSSDQELKQWWGEEIKENIEENIKEGTI